jgi:hypothetical protein
LNFLKIDLFKAPLPRAKVHFPRLQVRVLCLIGRRRVLRLLIAPGASEGALAALALITVKLLVGPSSVAWPALTMVINSNSV